MLKENLFESFRVPLMIIEGPLIMAQLLETTFLTLINFARFCPSCPDPLMLSLKNHPKLEILALSLQTQLAIALQQAKTRSSF
jgi:hypothetical protein